VWRHYLYCTGRSLRSPGHIKRCFGQPIIHYTRGICPEPGKRIVVKEIVALGKLAPGVLAIGQLGFGKYVLGQICFGGHVWSTKFVDAQTVEYFQSLLQRGLYLADRLT